MQPHQTSRIDLGGLKVEIVKKLGPERSKRYFYYLHRFLSQKLSKSEYDKLCSRVLGRENLPLHNQFIKSILGNACHAKSPPPIQAPGPTKSGIHVTNSSPSREDGHGQSGAILQNHNQNAKVWSNGVLPVSPRKVRSGARERKSRDRLSHLGPNGKVDNVSRQSTCTEDSSSKAAKENGTVTLTPCDYQRPTQHLHPVAELPEKEKDSASQYAYQKLNMCSKGPSRSLVVEDGEEVEQSDHLILPRSPLLAPLGIPYCSASVGGSSKLFPVGAGDFISLCDSGSLPDTDTLRKRMEHIAVSLGMGGVSVECANTLNIMLDLYLKRLIRSCVDMAGVRSADAPIKHRAHKQQIQDKVINGMWPCNHLYVQNAGWPPAVVTEQRPQSSVSLLDFKVAMELNPQQLGEDWSLLLERICMNTFDG